MKIRVGENCIEIREILFKNWKWWFEITNQTPPDWDAYNLFQNRSAVSKTEKQAAMAFPIPRATFSWVSSFRSSSLSHSHLLPIPLCLSSLTHSLTPMRAFDTLASLSNTTAHNPSSPPTLPSHSHKVSKNRWKPMCLYYTQGKCTKVSLNS